MRPVTVRSSRRPQFARYAARLGAVAVVTAALFIPAAADAQLRREAPKALTDAEFWEFFTTMSEPGGTFSSENYVSNEVNFQDVIPSLQRSLTRDGVYLGVGPEQNFTYIANVKPRMAVIFDIRRQNAMAHLMYKALFELSPTRAEFVSRLFSRPAVAKLGTGVTPGELFAAATAAVATDSARSATYDEIIKTLMVTHGFSLSGGDVASIQRVYGAFSEAGPNIHYAFRPSNGMVFNNSSYPAYGMLQTATNADSVQMAFLATEANYQAVRELQLRNLIVPVVGDFGGPKAIRSVGEYLRQRRMTVVAFYLSNVEQYLFQQYGAADRFYENVATLPIDSTSTFIRSVPGSGGTGGFVTMNVRGGALVTSRGIASMATGSNFSFSVFDSNGVRTIRIVQDSAGTTVTRILRDSAGQLVTRSIDSVRTPPTTASISRDSLAAAQVSLLNRLRDSLSLRAAPPRAAPAMTRVMGGLLASGLASIRQTLDAHAAGQVVTYQHIIAMTKTTGWR